MSHGMVQAFVAERQQGDLTGCVCFWLASARLAAQSLLRNAHMIWLLW